MTKGESLKEINRLAGRRSVYKGKPYKKAKCSCLSCQARGGQMKKLKFQMDCTKMRKQEGGEWLWHYFMKGRGHKMFDAGRAKRYVDLSTFLEDGETIEEFTRDDDTTRWSVDMSFNPYVVWLNYAGFEFFFAEDGVLERALLSTKRRKQL